MLLSKKLRNTERNIDTSTESTLVNEFEDEVSLEEKEFDESNLFKDEVLVALEDFDTSEPKEPKKPTKPTNGSTSLVSLVPWFLPSASHRTLSSCVDR